MLLKKLELQGFKSFIDHTTLNFEPGISAIVGPNGCGKSNISDAIRWVLGEQSAKVLRGSKLADVIFNGTDTRKPFGLAEVSLTLSNPDRKLPVDYAEVVVTRRSFRSGESEYLINKVPCRLKDIHNLFNDTGIGTEGYSLLEQGKMDLILSSKPMERRFVFEEAAGITHAKVQREEALRKLEATDQNLLRSNDILQEIKRQIGSLERQARKAEKYQTLKAELDRLQSRLLLSELQAARAQLSECDRELKALQEQYAAVETALRSREGRIAEAQLELLHAEEALSQASQIVHQMESQAAQTDKQIELNRSQIRFQVERQASSLGEAEQLRQKAALLHSQWEAARSSLESEEIALRSFKTEMSGLEAHLRYVTGDWHLASKAVQVMQQRSLEQTQRRLAAEAEKEASRVRYVQTQERASHLRAELAHTEQQEFQAGQALEAALHEAGGQREQAFSLEEDLSGYAAHKRELESALGLAEDLLAIKQLSLSSQRARLGVLEEFSSALEGFEGGARSLLLAAQKGESSAPVLHSLARLVRTRPEYEPAVEIGLGHRLQVLLAESSKDGFRALQWLADQQHGRASFLVAREVREFPPALPEELLREEGVVGTLASVLEAPDLPSAVVEWLAGRLLLVRDLECALRLQPRLPSACAAVTLRGVTVSAEGVVTGGSPQTVQRGLISREREIEELRARICEEETQLREGQIERERLEAELSELAQRIERRLAELQGAHIRMAELKKEHAVLLGDRERLLKELAEKRCLADEAEVEAASAHARVESLERSLQELSSLETDLRQNLEEKLSQVERLRSEEEKSRAACANLRVQEAQAAQKVEHLLATRARLEAELAEQEAAAARREAEAEQAKQEQLKLEQSTEELEQQLRQGYIKIEQARQAQLRAANQRQELQEKQSAAEQELRQLRAQLAQQAEQRHQREMAAQELRLKATQLEKTLQCDYHLSLEECLPGEPYAPEEQVLPQRLEELKAKLTELGVVNPAAAEEYRELEQRHSHLLSQLEDLRAAKADLQKVIARINEESRERFLSTFERVHENFKRIFRLLFGGGEARLLLEDADLLEAGIEIIARPPGKRQQSISLLSGGEKALTAIALLFALFDCKPSPFCVLDEIDAPLDDANIGRFTALLSEYALKVQFIVITHSKLTMERADVLYGITMEEAGVSRVVSARFKDEAKSIA